MSWGVGAWRLALLAVALLAVIVAWTGLRHHSRLRRRFGPEVLTRILPTQVRARRAARDVLALLGLTAAVVALAEPMLGKEFVEIEKKGVDIVLAVDLSRSMDAEDVSPSRLERARREIYDLLDVAQGDRIGLVIFAGGAYPRMPLSHDRAILRLLVDELDTDTFQVQGSEIGEAIRVSLDLLTSSRDKADQAIVILSDGEAHRIEDALSAAAEAARSDVRIYTLGIGLEPAPIPLGDGTWLGERGGKTILSRPSEDVLKEVARITGGAYVRSVASDKDIARLYQTEIRGTLRAAGSGVVQKEVPRSGFQWPLGIAVTLLLGAAWLGEGRRRWGAAAVGVIALGLVAAPARAAGLADGDAMYRSGDYAGAVEVFTELAIEDPTDPNVLGRLGAARFRAGDFEGAARAFDTQARLAGRGTVDATYNAGNAHWEAGRLEEALARYDRVLQLRPGHERAAQNRQILVQELEARRQEQEQRDQQQEQQQQQGSSEECDNPQEGEGEGDQEQEGTPDEEQDGASQSQSPEGEGAGEPAEGESDEESSTADGTTEEGQEGAGDQELQEDGDSELADLDELQDGEGQPLASPGEPGQEGTTPAQALQLLDGVEEGRPRVVIPGDARGGKQW